MTPLPPLTKTTERILARLLAIFSYEQLDQIAEFSEEVCDRSGHGEVVIEFKSRHPRFICPRLRFEAQDPRRQPFE
jgi:hypothetical protein